jgi:uncharacterized repeat protein (TIGR03803 family)
VFFKLTPDGALTNIASVPGNPIAGLVQASDGNFYGTGSSGNGTIFMLTPAGALTTLFTFNGAGNGSTPTAGLLQGADGNFYGSTFYGGANNCGTLFEMKSAGTRTLTPLASLSHTNGTGPDAGWMQSADGNFYGTTSSGGNLGGGNIFEIVRTAPVFLSASQTAGTLTLTWNGVAGQTYQMQSCADLLQGGWSNFGDTIVATNATMITTDSAPTDLQRFYRIVLP